MYNIANHYENIYQHLQTIITDPTVIYLHPFGSTQPENIETLRDDSDPPDMRNPPESRGPVFIFYDQEPLNFNYNKNLFDYIVSTTQGPYVLVNTEKDSVEKDRICDHYKFASIDYFFHIFAAADWYRGHQYLPHLVEPAQRTLSKSYITFNRLTSNERVYRSIFVSKLFKQGILEHGHVSYSDVCPDNHLPSAENLTKARDDRLISSELCADTIHNITLAQQPNPLRIDFADQKHIPNQSMALSPLPQLMESFVFVVTETCYWQTKTHLTEKIFKPIVLKMPFVLVGCADNLKYLRNYGFKTFGDYWDESYDSIQDPIERMDAVVKILNNISSMSNQQQQEMLLDMQTILEHNYQLFNSPAFIAKEWNTLKQSLTDISKYYRRDIDIPFTINQYRQFIPLAPNEHDSKYVRG